MPSHSDGPVWSDALLALVSMALSAFLLLSVSWSVSVSDCPKAAMGSAQNANMYSNGRKNFIVFTVPFPLCVFASVLIVMSIIEEATALRGKATNGDAIDKE